MDTLLPSLLVFLLVLASIPLLGWAARRARLFRAASSGGLSIVGTIGVGPRERIAIVRADRKWLVVGITQQSISVLCTLDDPPRSDEA